MPPAPPSMPLLDLAVLRRDGRDTVFVSGEIDLASAPTLTETISCLLASGRCHILVDLDGVTFMDGAAVGVLIASDLRTREAGGSLQITRNAACQRILGVTGERHLLEVRETP